MQSEQDDHFGAEVAARYDDGSGPHFDPAEIERTVDVLCELAAGGPVLEFAIGTGRIGLPLAARGVPVSGIEYSEAMVDRLRAKPGGGELDVVVGDMTDVRVEGTFSLVVLVFNTIGNVWTQDRQTACFTNAAAHLGPGGRFVVEVGVPALRNLPPGSDSIVFTHRDGYVGFDHYVDLVAQQAVSHHVHAGDEEYRTPFRYVWPSELDLMARVAGMTLEHRWADWDRSPFTGESPSHVSVWRCDG